jgi:hypothetical protein
MNQEKSVVDLTNLSDVYILHREWVFEEKLVVDIINLDVPYDTQPLHVCILTKKTDASAAPPNSCTLHPCNKEYNSILLRLNQSIIDANNEVRSNRK